MSTLLLRLAGIMPNGRLFRSALPNPGYPTLQGLVSHEVQGVAQNWDIQSVSLSESIVWDGAKCLLSKHLQAGAASPAMGDSFDLFP